MYDEVLGKKRFFEEFSKKGFSVSEIEAEWQKLHNMFIFNLAAATLESLPDDKERELEFGLKPTDPKDIAKLLEKLNDYIEKNPNMINREEILKKAFAMTADEYNKLTNSDYFVVK